MNANDTTATLARLIRAYRYRFASERGLQDGLERVFAEAGYAYVREHHLGPGDIIDFLLQGSIGVEVKVGGSLSAATRQLHRYAGYDAVDALVLVTSRCTLDHLPSAFRGKPIEVVTLKGNGFFL